MQGAGGVGPVRACARPRGRARATSPPAPAGADSASRTARRGRRRAAAAAASSTRAALSVHTSGRKRPVASAKPATMPGRRRRRARRLTADDHAGGADRDDHVARPGAQTRARRAALSPVPGAEQRAAPAVRPAASAGRRAPAAARGAAPERELEQVGAVLAGRRRPVAGAAGVAAVGAPASSQVRCARRAARSASRAAGTPRPCARRCSGSCSASQRSLVTVNDATGTDADRLGPGAPPAAAELVDQVARRRRPSGCRSTAAPAARPRRRRRGRPCRAAGRRRRSRRRRRGRRASASAVCSAAHHASRVRPRCRPGAAARPLRTSSPGLGVADDDLARLGRGVDAGDQPGPVSHGRGC